MPGAGTRIRQSCPPRGPDQPVGNSVPPDPASRGAIWPLPGQHASGAACLLAAGESLPPEQTGKAHAEHSSPSDRRSVPHPSRPFYYCQLARRVDRRRPPRRHHRRADRLGGLMEDRPASGRTCSPTRHSRDLLHPEYPRVTGSQRVIFISTLAGYRGCPYRDGAWVPPPAGVRPGLLAGLAG